MSDVAQTTLTCPQCGGENPLPSGARLLRCAFCDATLFVDRGGLVSHYRLPRLLDEAAARAALLRWMAGNDTVKDLDKRARIQDLSALAFPVWMFRLRGAAGETVRVEPAAPTPIPSLADLRIPAGQLQPFTDGGEGAEVIEAAVPLATAREWLGQAGQGGEPAETDLVHLPLWRATYTYGGRSYTALVEASTGEVLASVFPAKSESPFVLVTVVGLLLFGVEGLVLSNLLLKVVAFGVTAVPLTALAYWVTSRV